MTQISALRRAACLVGNKSSSPSGKAQKQLVGSASHNGQGPVSRAVWKRLLLFRDTYVSAVGNRYFLSSSSAEAHVPSSSRCAQTRHIDAREARTAPPHMHVHIRALLEAHTQTQGHVQTHRHTHADIVLQQHRRSFSVPSGLCTSISDCLLDIYFSPFRSLEHVKSNMSQASTYLLCKSAPPSVCPAPQIHSLVHSTSIY